MTEKRGTKRTVSDYSDGTTDKPAFKQPKNADVWQQIDKNKKLMPKRPITVRDKQEFHQILQDIKSCDAVIQTATIMRAVALHKLFIWIDVFYGKHKQNKWWNLNAKYYGIDYTLKNAKRYAKLGDAQSQSVLSAFYRQSHGQIKMNLTNCTEILRRWESGHNQSIQQIAKEFIGEFNNKKQQKQELKQLEKQQRELSILFNAKIKAVKRCKDDDKKERLKEEAKSMKLKLDGLDAKIAKLRDINSQTIANNKDNPIIISSNEDSDIKQNEIESKSNVNDGLLNKFESDVIDQHENDEWRFSERSSSNDNTSNAENVSDINKPTIAILSSKGSESKPKLGANVVIVNDDNNDDQIEAVNETQFDPQRVIYLLKQLYLEREEINNQINVFETILKEEKEENAINELTDNINDINI